MSASMDCTNEIEALKKLLEATQVSHRDLCRRKAEAVKALDELEQKELQAYACIEGLMLAIDKLSEESEQGERSASAPAS